MGNSQVTRFIPPVYEFPYRHAFKKGTPLEGETYILSEYQCTNCKKMHYVYQHAEDCCKDAKNERLRKILDEIAQQEDLKTSGEQDCEAIPGKNTDS
jgi:hypothetical protein